MSEGRSKHKADARTATHYRDASARPAPLAVLVRHPASGASFRLESGVCVVGSGAAADLTIADNTVSRLHVELQLVPEGVVVHDLGSRNGTFYLGSRVEKATVGPGARLEVGGAAIFIEADIDALQRGVQPSADDGEGYRGIVGRGVGIRRLFGVLRRLEGSLVTVLLEGESGVGKEVFARALHEGSSCADGPLIVVNCGAIPRELVASELFGHKKGSFTGATENRKGAFELADGGTLFLDELGELPIDVQPVLLRALEAGEVRPVGGDAAMRVRVRVIAATNRQLADEVQTGAFREDLYYRLAVVRLVIPPLRERLDDIEPLANHFARLVGVGDLPPDVIESLKSRSWPGNARELRNAVQAYAALGVLPEPTRAKANMLDVALREAVDPGRPYADQKEQLVEHFTRLYLEALLERTGGNQSSAARIAGLDRSYVGRLVSKYGLGKRG